MASADLETPEITTNLNDFLATFKDESVNKCIESITYDINSQTVVVQIRKLLNPDIEKVEKRHEKVRVKDLADERIKKLSESYREKFPELLDRFKEWKPVRENLINVLSSSSNRLDRNFAFVSSFRIITAAADIFGTLGRAEGKSITSWSNFAMENSSTLGLLSLVFEKIFAKYTLKGVRKAIKLDQDMFRKITDWFKQTEELDKAVKNIFPYGIDPDITKKIAKSASDFDDCNKIFMSIIASNVKENVHLFKDEKFLDKADQFANSEAGKQWFHKVLLNNDPNMNHYLNSKLNDDIQCYLKSSSADNPELYLDGYRLFSTKVKLKNTLNLITIISAGSNLLFGNTPEESEALRDLSSKTKEDLEGIKRIVQCLKPTGVTLDRDLL